MDIIKEKWEEILYTVKLEHELTDVSFDTWLKPLKQTGEQSRVAFDRIAGALRTEE